MEMWCGVLSPELWRCLTEYLSLSEISNLKKTSRLGREVTSGVLSGQIVVASGRKAYILDVERCRLVHRLEVCAEYESCLSAKFSSDGRRIVTSSTDDTAKIFDSQTGELLLTLRGHNAGIRTSAFSLDCKRVITASRDCTGRIWSAQTGKQELRLEHEHSIWCVAFSNDGRRAITTTIGAAHIWSADSGAHELILNHGSTHFVSSAFFTADDDHLVTSGSDRIVRLWSATTGHLLTQYNTSSPRSHAVISKKNISRLSSSYDDAFTQKSLQLRTLAHGELAQGSAFYEDTDCFFKTTGLTLELWDNHSGALLSQFKFAYSSAFSCDFTHHKARVLA